LAATTCDGTRHSIAWDLSFAAASAAANSEKQIIAAAKRAVVFARRLSEYMYKCPYDEMHFPEPDAIVSVGVSN
jgi:hypothetical protein